MFKTELKFKELDSTSDFLKQSYQDFSSFTIVRTDYQLKGRGQFDRTWQSEKGQNLLCSILLKDVSLDKMDEIKDLTLRSLIITLGKYGIQVQFKAPNDLYVQDKKICGILIENLTIEKVCLYVVIGIGLNINQTNFPDLSATSMKTETNKTQDIENVYQFFISDLLERLNLCV